MTTSLPPFPSRWKRGLSIFTMETKRMAGLYRLVYKAAKVSDTGTIRFALAETTSYAAAI